MKYTASEKSIATHTVPKWYNDCKLGIFIHWGAYAVPAYAPSTLEFGSVEPNEDYFANNPYSEWYLNSLRVGHGPVHKYHKKTYGKDFPYENFADMWKAENWDPASWVKLFKQSGAGYIVPTAKHHDGFCLWNSRYTDYNSTKKGPQQDLMATLSVATKAEGLQFGIYYSGIIDWQYSSSPVTNNYEVENPDNVTYAYSDYAYNQVMELIDTYQPAVLWNDIGWPQKGRNDLYTLFAHYYNTVPHGVVNDRWNDIWCDFTTKEYTKGARTLDKKWELCRGLGLSFGYNRAEDESKLISKNKLISLLIETVAYNGNLLINVGPKADGTIPKAQEERLLWLGSWLKTNGDGIYGTSPYIRNQESGENGVETFFTQKQGNIYLFFDGLTAGDNKIIVKGMGRLSACAKALSSLSVTFKAVGADLIVTLHGIPENSPPVGICIAKK